MSISGHRKDFTLMHKIFSSGSKLQPNRENSGESPFRRNNAKNTSAPTATASDAISAAVSFGLLLD